MQLGRGPLDQAALDIVFALQKRLDFWREETAIPRAMERMAIEAVKQIEECQG